MRFVLLDRVEHHEEGQSLRARKAVSLAEEYLADHFPTFPVLPGVMMIEAMTQAAAWIVRLHYDYQPTLIRLAAARNVRYKNFVAPGGVLTVEANVRQIADDRSQFTAAGYVDDTEAVNARIELRHSTLAETDGGLASQDDRLRSHFRTLWPLLYRPAAR